MKGKRGNAALPVAQGEAENAALADADKRRRAQSADERLMDCLRACAHYLRHQAERRGSQRRALAILCAQGPAGMTQRALIERMGVQPGSMSELLGKLEDQGYIAREKNAVDKRNMDLHLLPAGQQALCDMQRGYEETLAQLFAALEEDEKTQLTALLKRLLDSWDKPYWDKPYMDGSAQPVQGG